MPLRAIQNRSLSDQVFEQIGREIMTGRYQPDTNLPAERTLAEVFGVNRHVVREALKRLEQVGVVKISQGGGTKVLDPVNHAGLDVLVLMGRYARGSEDETDYWLSVLEMRAAIAADVARLCAIRANRDLKDEIKAVANRMSSASSEQELFELEIRFWDLVHDGAGNIAYRLALNSLLRVAEMVSDLARQWSMYELKLSGFRLRIAEAIASGDAAAAEARTREAMRAAIEGNARRTGKASKTAGAVKRATADIAGGRRRTAVVRGKSRAKKSR